MDNSEIILAEINALKAAVESLKAEIQLLQLKQPLTAQPVIYPQWPYPPYQVYPTYPIITWSATSSGEQHD